MVKKEISDPHVLAKIDPLLHLRYEETVAGGHFDRPLLVLLRLEGALDGMRYKALERKKIKVDSVLGDLLTISVPAWAIPDLAEMDFVQSLEMARQ